MKIKVNLSNFNEGLEKLSKDYKILAPVSLAYKGTYSDTDLIKYGEVSKIEDMELHKKSSFSPKEVILPINQVLMYFTEDEFKVSNYKENRKLLVFLRACDIHAVKRLDEIYLGNGPEDYYYKRIRENVKFVLIGCKESFRNCFCVSMDSNKSDDYVMGLNLDKDTVSVHIKDETLNVFEGESIDFEVDYVKSNNVNVEILEIDNVEKLAKNPMWDEYDERCIACGRCNFVCPTCTCFTMQDVYYKENENVGERRRVWASCHVDGYTDMAGGHSFREKYGERMRFKTMHKIHDYKKRFGYHMCIGCGRCDDACPQYISFSSCIDKVNDVVKSKEEK